MLSLFRLKLSITKLRLKTVLSTIIPNNNKGSSLLRLRGYLIFFFFWRERKFDFEVMMQMINQMDRGHWQWNQLPPHNISIKNSYSFSHGSMAPHLSGQLCIINSVFLINYIIETCLVWWIQSSPHSWWIPLLPRN